MIEKVITIISIDAPPFKYPHFLATKEKGVPTGVYPAIVEKRTFNSASYLFTLFYDVRIVNGPIIKMCQFQPLDKWNPDFKDFPKPGDPCCVYVERIRLKRANFRPHMRRRLKAVRR